MQRTLTLALALLMNLHTTCESWSENPKNSTDACLAASGFRWLKHVRNQHAAQMMSTPQYHAYPTGFASRCDWVLGTRRTFWGKRKRRKINRNTLRKTYNLAWRDTSRPPLFVFVRTDLVQRFYFKVMPCLNNQFVLVTGDHDITIPRQVETMYPKFLSRTVYTTLLADDRLIHHFAENLDDIIDTSKVTPIPVGINPIEFKGLDADFIIPSIPKLLNITNRPLIMLQVDRIRVGATWNDRLVVKRLCETNWRYICKSARAQPGLTFFRLLSMYPFILCPHGYGLDPSPKAWEGIAFGAVPIIQHFAGDAAYRHLPVVFVDAWIADSISKPMLETWRKRMAPFYENQEIRMQVLRRLKADFWWEKLEEAATIRHKSMTSYMSLEWRDEPNHAACDACSTDDNYSAFAFVF